MSIDRTSPLKPVSTVQPRETTDAPVTNSRAAKTTASTSTSVTLSDAQAKLMQPGSSDINLERVEALKLAIRNGELKMDTGKIADAYAEKYPNIVKVIHQENGGHGEGVNQGIRNASGMYFKVVDSDDWLDAEALQKVMQTLRGFAAMEQPVDLLMCNYVYEHVVDNTHHTVSYKSILPQDRVFAWDEIGHFPPSQNILMHTVIYRTQILRDSGLELPKHTFYVDNVFVYQPLPLCQRLYYMDIDLYRYFIGRDDQSVNESVMVKRVDQQLRVTKIMIDAVDLYALPESQKKLRAYMFNYLSMMMAISSVFLTMDGRPEAFEKKTELWQYLKNHDERVYNKCRHSVAGACNLPGTLGHKITLWGYHVAQKIFKFN